MRNIVFEFEGALDDAFKIYKKIFRATGASIFENYFEEKKAEFTLE